MSDKEPAGSYVPAPVFCDPGPSLPMRRTGATHATDRPSKAARPRQRLSPLRGSDPSEARPLHSLPPQGSLPLGDLGGQGKAWPAAASPSTPAATPALRDIFQNGPAQAASSELAVPGTWQVATRRLAAASSQLGPRRGRTRPGQYGAVTSSPRGFHLLVLGPAACAHGPRAARGPLSEPCPLSKARSSP